jgi:hypothetical protein
MDKLHCIHSRGGQIGPGTETTPADVDAIVKALGADPRSHLILHFHGGLVSKAVGTRIADDLAPLYQHGGYPVFYVWESGFMEAIRNNLKELAGEPVFKQLVRKLLQYALEHLGGSNGARSIAPGAVDPVEVRQAFEAFWAHPSQASVPYRQFGAVASRASARSAAISIDVDQIQADLEGDAELGAALASLPDLKPHARSALSKRPVAEHRSPFSENLADRVSEQPGARGLISWYKVAVLVKNILVQLLKRYAEGRDHGLYATVVEEVLREVKLAGSGLNEWGKALQWNRMKQDALDAFGPDPQRHAGTALLQRLKEAMAGGLDLRRITLVGHSTGAIYIAHWLAAADKLLPPGVRFDVVYLAPAITYDLFDQTVSTLGHRIDHFRMFCMRDELERDDQVWGEDDELDAGQDWRRFVYPSSLLYLVSGILESAPGKDGELADAPDMPLLGMERYLARDDVYGEDAFPAVARVRAWLQAEPHRAVWSSTADQAPGLNSCSVDHGGFDNDDTTRQSLVAMVQGW